MIDYFKLNGKIIEVKDGVPVSDIKRGTAPPRKYLPRKVVDRETWLRDRLDKLEFKPEYADPYFYFTEKLDDHLSYASYKTLALFFSQALQIRLAREYYRRKSTIIYWFQFHWKAIKKFLRHNRVKISYDGQIHKLYITPKQL